MEARGAFEVARVEGMASGVSSEPSLRPGVPAPIERIVLNMWAELAAPVGRTHEPLPDPKAEKVIAGRVFAEHVFTRLFAPANERKVTRLDVPGGPEVPEAVYVPKPFEKIIELPEGVRALDETWRVDPTEIVMGLCHTDSNQHVNSLAYLRLSEEAALQFLSAAGRPTSVLSRALEIGYRKPCFAEDRMRVALKVFERAKGLGAVGIIVTEKDATTLERARPHAFIRMTFEP
jgi:hypothetical protein